MVWIYFFKIGYYYFFLDICKRYGKEGGVGGGLNERGDFELRGGNLLLGGFFFLYVGLFILCKEKK